MDSSIISIIIVLITMGLFVWNRLPISVVAILGSVAMAMFIPEMDLSAVYSGFSATGWPMVVGMCVVSAALFETGIARKIGEKIGNSFLAKTERRFIVTVRIECPEAQIFASTPNNKSVWKVCVHNKTDTNKTNRAIIYDSSVCGYEHPRSNSFNNTITERKTE